MAIRRVPKGESIQDSIPEWDKGYMSKNKLFNLIIDNVDNKRKFVQFDKETKLVEHVYTFKQATALFRGFYANKVISRIQKIEGISRKAALEIYHTNKEQIKQNRITAIQNQEPTVKNRKAAIDFYNTLIRRGNYKKLQMYGS